MMLFIVDVSHYKGSLFISSLLCEIHVDIQDESVMLVHRMTAQVLHVHRLILAYWEDCGKVIAWLNTDAHWLGPWACPVDALHVHLLGEMQGYITI